MGLPQSPCCVGGWTWGVSDKGLQGHLQPRPRVAFVMDEEKARALQNTGRHRGKRMGETQLMGQPQIPSGKRQRKHEHGIQQQEVEGLEHLQTCSDRPAPAGLQRA